MRVSFVLRRVVFAALLVLMVSSAALWMVRFAPGDYVTQALGTSRGAVEAEQMRARLGLNRSAASQYVDWLKNLARLDFGASFVDGRPVAALVLDRGLNTALLAFAALTLATVIGVGVGTWTGSRPHGLVAAIVTPCSLAAVSMPSLLTSLLFAVLAARTRWLPVGGMQSAGVTGVSDVLWHMVAPTCALALPIAASFERIHAKAVQDTLRQPFIASALARGVGPERLLWRSALKPSLKSLASVYGIGAAALLSGSFAVEVVTAWPGLGRLMVDALLVRDLYVVAGCAFAVGLCLAIATLLADIALALADPRVAEQ